MIHSPLPDPYASESLRSNYLAKQYLCRFLYHSICHLCQGLILKISLLVAGSLLQREKWERQSSVPTGFWRSLAIAITHHFILYVSKIFWVTLIIGSINSLDPNICCLVQFLLLSGKISTSCFWMPYFGVCVCFKVLFVPPGNIFEIWLLIIFKYIDPLSHSEFSR